MLMLLMDAVNLRAVNRKYAPANAHFTRFLISTGISIWDFQVSFSINQGVIPLVLQVAFFLREPSLVLQGAPVALSWSP